MHVHGLEQVLLGHYGQIAGSDWRWTCSGADFMVGDMCHEWDVQDISQAPLVEGIKTSFGCYSPVWAPGLQE